MSKKIIISIVAIALVCAGGAWWYFTPTQTSPVTPSSQTYSNQTYGISFEYPLNYLLQEREVGNAERGHYNITLVEDTQTNRDLLSGKIVGEGPTAITVDIFQNNLDKESPEQWIRNNSSSNFKLSNGELASSTTAGAVSFAYSWDGLYRGESIVFAHKDNIIMLSVTSLTPQDRILSDFLTVVGYFLRR